MSTNVTGRIVRFLEVVQGQTQAGKAWSKQQMVIDTETQYDNIICMEVFGVDKVAELQQYKIGDKVNIDYNIKCNEYQAKFYTTLQVFKISLSS